MFTRTCIYLPIELLPCQFAPMRTGAEGISPPQAQATNKMINSFKPKYTWIISNTAEFQWLNLIKHRFLEYIVNNYIVEVSGIQNCQHLHCSSHYSRWFKHIVPPSSKIKKFLVFCILPFKCSTNFSVTTWGYRGEYFILTSWLSPEKVFWSSLANSKLCTTSSYFSTASYKRIKMYFSCLRPLAASQSPCTYMLTEN